ncbi:hypothetical protein MN608_06210 [Microdochium nivale]|nr:hypothetical protein MN608_06210 [Microdochium nivale]
MRDLSDLSYRMVASKLPLVYLFCAVARLGPDNTHRPLAIAQGPCFNNNHPLQYRLTPSNVILIYNYLSSSSNRPFIKAELALAAEFYRATGPGSSLAHFEVLCPAGIEPALDEEQAEKLRQAPVPEAGFEFPFILNCLLTALSSTTSSDDFICTNVRPWPLGAVYNHLNLGQGLVVFDITDCNNVACGVHAFKTQWFGYVDERFGFLWDDDDDNPPVNRTRGMLPPGLSINHVPLSAREFAAKFARGLLADFDNALDQLDRVLVVDARASDFIWPQSQDIRSNSHH